MPPRTRNERKWRYSQRPAPVVNKDKTATQQRRSLFTPRVGRDQGSDGAVGGERLPKTNSSDVVTQEAGNTEMPVRESSQNLALACPLGPTHAGWEFSLLLRHDSSLRHDLSDRHDLSLERQICHSDTIRRSDTIYHSNDRFVTMTRFVTRMTNRVGIATRFANQGSAKSCRRCTFLLFVELGYLNACVRVRVCVR